MRKDFKTLLGTPVKRRYATAFCGRGKLAACSASLWAELKKAGDALAATQGADPVAWRKSLGDEFDTFAPLELVKMRYANRPSGIQQVISFDGHR